MYEFQWPHTRSTIMPMDLLALGERADTLLTHGGAHFRPWGEERRRARARDSRLDTRTRGPRLGLGLRFHGKQHTRGHFYAPEAARAYCRDAGAPRAGRPRETAREHTRARERTLRAHTHTHTMWVVFHARARCLCCAFVCQRWRGIEWNPDPPHARTRAQSHMHASIWYCALHKRRAISTRANGGARVRIVSSF